MKVYHASKREDIRRSSQISALAFDNPGELFFREIIEKDPSFDNENNLDNILFLSDNEDISTLVIFPREAKILGKYRKIACLGSVATLKNHRGKGAIRRLMEEALVFMKDKGYELSFLFGKTELYSRFGYSPLTVDEYRFNYEGESTIEIKPFSKLGREEAQYIYDTHIIFNKGREGVFKRDVDYIQRFIFGFNERIKIEKSSFYRLFLNGGIVGYAQIIEKDKNNIILGEIGLSDISFYEESLKSISNFVSKKGVLCVRLLPTHTKEVADKLPVKEKANYKGMMFNLLQEIETENGEVIKDSNSLVEAISAKGEYTFYFPDGF